MICFTIFILIHIYWVQRRKKEAKIFSKSNILHSASSFCFQLRGSQSFSAPLCSFTKWCWLTKRFTEGNGSNSLTGSLHPPGAKLILNPCNNSISASINKQKQGETCSPAVHGGFFLTLIPKMLLWDTWYAANHISRFISPSPEHLIQERKSNICCRNQEWSI